MDRRDFLRSLALGAAGAGLAQATGSAQASGAVMGEDGLYVQPWFLESFLELADDLTTATESGKRFAVIWELRGCPYCKQMHKVNFARPDVSGYVRQHFDILQLNLIGSRLVTDLDGEEMSEKQLAAKYGVRFTPTIQFFPESIDGLAEMPAVARESARLPGYLPPDDFLAMFRFVQEKAYRQGSFKDYLAAAKSG